ncbi:MAG: metalloregulator ArsR/SmtB family transcription factor [Caulobacteraceae bacterium]
MANSFRALDPLSTLADPTRRRIFELLASRPSSVGALASGLPVTRSAVSQHLKVLGDAGLVANTAEGTRRVYRLDPRGIGAIRDWLDSHWARALESFQAFADAQAAPLQERTQE